MVTRIYIAGPIAGIPDGNREAFALVAQNLKEAGYEPVNPWDIPPVHEGECIGRTVEHEPNHRYGCLLRSDIEALMHCDAIFLMEGWEQSVGAQTEEHVARSLGLAILFEGSFPW